MQAQKLFLFRAFFPSWKLFEDASEVPVLFCRYRQNSSNEWSDWLMVIEPLSRKWWHLFLNPQVNLHHAFRSALGHLMVDLSENIQFDSQKVEQLTSYHVIKQIVFWKLKNKKWDSFQFKIVARNYLLEKEIDDILISIIYNSEDFPKGYLL